MKSLFPIKAALISILILGGCIATSLPTLRTETAQRIAAPAWMIKRDIAAEPYLLRVYERIHKQGGIAHVYIEGDGIEGKWGSTGDFTPVNPLALHLASKDNAHNLIYIARPCQFNGRIAYPHDCKKSEWQENRFSKEVVQSYNIALDEIANRYRIKGFNLIGYTGGAALAAILTAQRKDILSLRTVSGAMDTQAYASRADDFPLSPDAENPVNYSADLVKIPQYHFIGGQDHLVYPETLTNYMQSLPPSNCVQTMMVQEAGHEAGWVDKWPELLGLPLSCSNGNASQIPELSSAVDIGQIPSSAEDLRAYDGKQAPEKP